MLKLSMRILLFSVIAILLLMIGTLPAAVVGFLLFPATLGLYLILMVILGSRLATVLLNYDITIHGAVISGTRSSVAGKTRWRTLSILSAGGLNLLIFVSIAVGGLISTVAPPVVFILTSFAVLVSNEIARKTFDISISILGVRVTKIIIETVTSHSTRERRELSQLSTGAEWIASSLTVFGHIDQPSI